MKKLSEREYKKLVAEYKAEGEIAIPLLRELPLREQEQEGFTLMQRGKTDSRYAKLFWLMCLENGQRKIRDVAKDINKKFKKKTEKSIKAHPWMSWIYGFNERRFYGTKKSSPEFNIVDRLESSKWISRTGGRYYADLKPFIRYYEVKGHVKYIKDPFAGLENRFRKEIMAKDRILIPDFIEKIDYMDISSLVEDRIYEYMTTKEGIVDKKKEWALEIYHNLYPFKAMGGFYKCECGRLMKLPYRLNSWKLIKEVHK